MSVTTAEVFKEIDEIRERANDLEKHCAPCLIKKGKADNSTKHGGFFCKETKPHFRNQCFGASEMATRQETAPC